MKTQRSVVKTAHQTEITGRYSEMIAQVALLANGWIPHESRTKEAYDILATNPETGRAEKVQVKTIRRRTDRGGDFVIYARKGDATTYDLADADWIIGVLADNGETPRVFILENICQTEYWTKEDRAHLNGWRELSIALDREPNAIALAA